MAKTNPIGVRFDEDLLNEFKTEKLAETPQGALSLLESYYRMNKLMNSGKESEEKKEEKKDAETDQSELLKQIEDLKKEKIPKERDTSLGRKVWYAEQADKIKKLEKQLK